MAQSTTGADLLFLLPTTNLIPAPLTPTHLQVHTKPLSTQNKSPATSFPNQPTSSPAGLESKEFSLSPSSLHNDSPSSPQKNI